MLSNWFLFVLLQLTSDVDNCQKPYKKNNAYIVLKLEIKFIMFKRAVNRTTHFARYSCLKFKK